MKRLLLAALSLATLAHRALADDTLLPRGTFCSATASDGLWAFRYSVANVYANCAAVQAALAARTTAPISAWSRGYYNINAMNTVTVRCSGGWRAFAGIGIAPLQQGQAYGGAYWGQACLFNVN